MTTTRAYDRDARCKRFPLLAALRERVLIWDGGFGTELRKRSLSRDDYRGTDGCSEILNETRADVVNDIHRRFLFAGADVIETNTFGASTIVLNEFGLAFRAYDLARRGAEIARGAAMAWTKHPHFVTGSIGPTTKLVSLGFVTEEEMRKALTPQISGLLDGGVDALQIETQIDLQTVAAAVATAREVMHQRNREVPLIVTVTMETTGTMLVGSDIGAALSTLEYLDVDVVGINCAMGPDLLDQHVRYLGRHSVRPIAVLPNAGLPREVGGETVFDLTPAAFADQMLTFIKRDGVRAVGGCCGVTPEHIAELAKRVH